MAAHWRFLPVLPKILIFAALHCFILPAVALVRHGDKIFRMIQCSWKRL
jgi:hypothetical protein